MKNKVCIIGSGNWGSAIALAVGVNTAAHPDIFERQVRS
jgi:glycerol-3-phosphate dehydrogenase (NAD+)